ncbi:VanW family protein [Patescibacteria group bacterium]|nr:VanW family protein [Patescibacteria group bacterium]
MSKVIQRRPFWLISLTLGVLLLIVASWYVSFDIVYAGRVMPGATLSNRNIGGLSWAEADTVVTNLITTAEQTKLNLVYQSDRYTYTIDQLGVELDRPATLDRIYGFGRTTSLTTNLRERFGGIAKLVSPRAVYKFTPGFNTVTNNLAKKYNQPAVEARVVVEKQHAGTLPAQPGLELSVETLKQLLGEQFGQLKFEDIALPIIDGSPTISTEVATATANHINQGLNQELILTARGQDSFALSPEQMWQWLEVFPKESVLVARLKSSELEKFVKSLESKVNQPMQNAIFKTSGKKLIAFQPDRPGRVLRTADAVMMIQQNFLGDQREIELAVNYLEPKTKLTDLNDLGINELVASGVSNFAGSPANRRHNIKTGASKFNNVIVTPTEMFSFNKILGTVDQTTGYLPELVIKGDETIPEFGGGLCQVSTTAFRAILNGGYPVMERHNHSYRVVYYEPAGTDATIYPPSPDLKFINDSPGYIVIQTYIEGNNLYFDFYGTRMDRRVVLEGPKIFNITQPPEPVYIETSTIPEGETKQIDTAHRGADTILYRLIYDADGKEIRKEEFKSHYVPWPAKFLVGVKAAPPVSTDLKNVPPESSGSEQAPIDITPPLEPETS